MASIKNLKKDIDYLIFEVVSDCFTAMSVKPDKNSDKLLKIISDAINLRNELFSRLNHPDGKNNPVKVKKYFRKLRSDLVVGVDKLFDQISQAIKD